MDFQCFEFLLREFFRTMSSNMVRLAFLTALILPVSVWAQGAKPWQTYKWSAVDKSGKRFTEEQFWNKRPPWNDAVVKHVEPLYPYEERARKHMGAGLFKMEIDLGTGAVRHVSVVKSTGYNRLDEAAKGALVGWKFTPNSWREVNLPVNFLMRTQIPSLSH